MKGITNASGGIPAGGIGTRQLADNAVTSAKIEANAVTRNYTTTLLADGWTAVSTDNGDYWYQDSSDITVYGKMIMDLDLSGYVSTTADVAYAQQIEEQYCNIYLAIFTKAGALRIFAKEQPTLDIPLKFLGVKK